MPSRIVQNPNPSEHDNAAPHKKATETVDPTQVTSADPVKEKKKKHKKDKEKTKTLAVEGVKKKKAKKSSDTTSHVSEASAALPSKPKKPHRYRPGTRALMEIRKYQKSTDLLLRKAPFNRLLRQIANDVAGSEKSVRFEKDAIVAMQIAGEAFLTQLMEVANFITVGRKKVTLQQKDMQSAMSVSDMVNGNLTAHKH